MKPAVASISQQKATLEQKTQLYWRVSRSYNSRSNEQMTFIRANKLLRDVLTTTNPKRYVAMLSATLLAELIDGTATQTQTNRKQ